MNLERHSTVSLSSLECFYSFLMSRTTSLTSQNNLILYNSSNQRRDFLFCYFKKTRLLRVFFLWRIWFSLIRTERSVLILVSGKQLSVRYKRISCLILIFCLFLKRIHSRFSRSLYLCLNFHTQFRSSFSSSFFFKRFDSWQGFLFVPTDPFLFQEKGVLDVK